MPVDALEHLRIYQDLVAQRAPFDHVAQQLADIMYPLGNDIQTIRWPGELRTQRLYDTTAMLSAERLAGYIYALVTNFHTSWFQFRIGPNANVTLDQAGEQWLDQAREIVQEEMTADDSPIPQSVYDLFLQETVFATGCHFVDEQPSGVSPFARGFRGYTSTALPWSTYVIKENVSHRVDTVYRAMKLTVRQAVQQWGLESLAPTMREIATDSANLRRLDQQFDFVHGVCPRVQRDPERDDRTNRPFQSLYLDVQHKHCVDEGGYRVFPYQCLRWGKPNVETPWGWGRGHMALPEALTLNAIDQDALRALRMHIFPPVWVIGAGRETVGTVSLRPGAINPIATGASVQWMNPGGNFNVQQLSIEARQQRIRQIFFLDILDQIPPLDGRPRGNVTAYEIAQRIRLTAQVLGPAFMRILHEFLNPFLDCCFDNLLHARVFPDPPESIWLAAAANNGRIDPEYLGPLARATQTEDVDAIDETIQFGLGIGQATGNYAILDNLDLDEAYRRRAKVRGVPAYLLRDPTRVRRLREERAQQQQQSQDRQAILDAAQAVGQAGPGLQAIQEMGMGVNGQPQGAA